MTRAHPGTDDALNGAAEPSSFGHDPQAQMKRPVGHRSSTALRSSRSGRRKSGSLKIGTGGQFLAAGLVDEVRMDVVSVVLGSGKRFSDR